MSEAYAHELVALCARFESYGTYADEGLNEGMGEGLPQRFDAAFNFVKTGGRFGRKESLEDLASRTNYFRETYAYGEEVAAPGIEPFLHHEGFVEAAREIHGRPVVEPAIVYANILLPGQELAVHTDVPEFRGASRKAMPEWLLVVMHHSGLFVPWRMPIATAVSWFQEAAGGAFAFYPEGAESPPRTLDARFNSAVVVDTDSVFHGVDRVADRGDEIPPYRPGMRLRCEEGDTWVVRDGEKAIARCRWPELRFSISWKAYCFEDEKERRHWREGSDDLSLDFILDRLEADLRARGRSEGARPEPRQLATLLVDEYVHFPPANS
ncbi:MAG: hypothetical protein JRH19_17685 [Deltaproteobacteria bacterium]|nr:hypothetical protein [Deltaproteobacteria bacterium]